MSSRAAWLLPVALVGLALPPSVGRDPPVAVPPERVQLLARLGADGWHAAGARGQGVKILVIDSGLRGWRSQLGLALPANALAKSFRADADLESRDSLHGVRCGEIIHAIAPDAELLFANWEPDDADSFLKAVEWGKRQGARLVSCSVIMPCWSDGEGGGPVHAALRRIMGDGDSTTDLLGIACAGNTAQRHWGGTFHAGADGCHEWAPGQAANAVTPWGDERVSIELCHPAGAVFSIQVVNTVIGSEVGRATTESSACSAVVRFMPVVGARYEVRVRSGSGSFHLSALGAWLERSTDRGSIPFPADGAEFVAVGAVDRAGRRAAYSSCGPNGPRPKPDFVAEVPTWTAVRPGTFSGTSAAAPQAAGLAALLLGRHPDWPPARVREMLRRAAVDIDPPGHDTETGYGLLRLDEPSKGLDRAGYRP
jgi:subtilisin family serine protease